MEFVILGILIILLIALIKFLPKIFYYACLFPSIFIGNVLSKFLGIIYCQLPVAISFIFIPYLIKNIYSKTDNELIAVSKYLFITFQVFIIINIITHIVSLIKSAISSKTKYYKPNMNLYFKYLYASVFLFLISSVFIYLLYLFMDNKNYLLLLFFPLFCIFVISSVGMFVYSFVKKVKYMILVDKPLKEIKLNNFIDANVFSFESEYLEESYFNDDDPDLLLTIGVIKKLIADKKIVNITLNDTLTLYENKYYNDKYIQLDNTLSEAAQLTKTELLDHVMETFDFDNADANDFAENYLNLCKYNMVEEEIEKHEVKSQKKSAGFFGSLVNLVKKGVNAYKGSQDKEKERMKDWPDKRLAQTAKSKQLLPAGMAAMQILKDRGYSASQIANM